MAMPAGRAENSKGIISGSFSTETCLMRSNAIQLWQHHYVVAVRIIEPHCNLRACNAMNTGEINGLATMAEVKSLAEVGRPIPQGS